MKKQHHQHNGAPNTIKAKVLENPVLKQILDQITSESDKKQTLEAIGLLLDEIESKSARFFETNPVPPSSRKGPKTENNS